MSADFTLKNKCAIVTGAARGIGYATAELFSAAGAAVLVADRDGEAAREAAQTISAARGAHVEAFEVDIADPRQVDAMVATAVDRLGGVDVLVNNAAHARWARILEISDEDWDYTYSVCLKGSFMCLQRAARVMRDAGRGGKIINVSSMTVPLGHTRSVAYSSMKGAIETLTRVAAVELAEHGIQVNAIAPGPTDTEMSRAALTEAGRAARLTRLPGGRFGKPSEVAGAALFLASSHSDWVTGTVLAVDGGYTATGVMEPNP